MHFQWSVHFGVSWCLKVFLTWNFSFLPPLSLWTKKESASHATKIGSFFQLRIWGLWNMSINMPKEKLACSKNIRQTLLVKKSHPSIWCVSFKMQNIHILRWTLWRNFEAVALALKASVFICFSRHLHSEDFSSQFLKDVHGALPNCCWQSVSCRILLYINSTFFMSNFSSQEKHSDLLSAWV